MPLKLLDAMLLKERLDNDMNLGDQLERSYNACSQPKAHTVSFSQWSDAVIHLAFYLTACVAVPIGSLYLLIRFVKHVWMQS